MSPRAELRKQGFRLEHNEPGCYGDGTFGHQHTRDRCAETLEACARYVLDDRWAVASVNEHGCAVGDVLQSLRDRMPDDAWDESEACDWLNEHAPVLGCFWGWLDGDFGLWDFGLWEDET